jgi:alpha-tubulin suppressor-like RCC1 family protein
VQPEPLKPRSQSAVATDGRAYCWGNNQWGQLGDRTKIARLTPTAVYGGLSFRDASAGHSHTCAVTTGDRAYCWGYNFGRVLGDGSDSPRRLKPTAVVGDLQFRQVAAGTQETCGVTTSEAVYCWGSAPTLVEGGQNFAQVDPSGSHTCGVTASALAYCWGFNLWGQLGDGTTTDRSTPAAVVGPM